MVQELSVLVSLIYGNVSIELNNADLLEMGKCIATIFGARLGSRGRLELIQTYLLVKLSLT